MTLDGPRLEPATGHAPTSLMIFLHGYGADGMDLIGIGQHWRTELPETAFVSPNAPDPCEQNPGGRQWFPFAGIDPHALSQGVRGAAPSLDAFIDAELARHGLDESRLVLVGFSQGTMMALYSGLRRPRQLAGIIGYSGLLPDPEHIEREALTRPPILLVHGNDDPLVPALASHAAAEILRRDGFDVKLHLRPNLQHGIDQEGLDLGVAFARNVLGEG